MNRTHTVYKHVSDANGAVLYVGCTNNLKRRTHEHRVAQMLEAGEHVEIVGEFPQREALAIESALILHYKPERNRRGVAGYSMPVLLFLWLAKRSKEDLDAIAKREAEERRAAEGWIARQQLRADDEFRPLPSRRRSA